MQGPHLGPSAKRREGVLPGGGPRVTPRLQRRAVSCVPRCEVPGAGAALGGGSLGLGARLEWAAEGVGGGKTVGAANSLDFFVLRPFSLHSGGRALDSQLVLWAPSAA